VEGSVTSDYIAQCAQGTDTTVTRIANGVPLGGELEHVDGGTLALAFAGRRSL
jgi:recombination protein RecR